MSKLIHQILIFLAKKILWRFRSACKNIPVILVAGNVGKSSQTLLLNQLFETSGYHVWSGTSQNKNRNTLTGLIMTLGEFSDSLEQAGFLKKLLFITKAIGVWLFKTWDFGSIPNILIYEIGVDRAGEMDDYIKVFGRANWVILSNFGPEHTVGFEAEFDLEKWLSIKSSITNLINQNPQFDLEKIELEGVLKNCYLEQFKLLELGLNYALPASFELKGTELVLKKTNLGTNEYQNIKLKVVRNPDFSLKAGDYDTTAKHLFPQSFARQIGIADLVRESFDLPKESLSSVLNQLTLPNGRFGFFDGINETKIVDGSYNSDPASLNSFLDLLLEIQPKKLNYIILGEMRELGDSAIEVHQEIINRLNIIQKDINCEIILLGATWLQCKFDPKLFQHYSKVGQIIKKFKADVPKKETWIWVKGSQNTIFLECLVESLLLHESDVDRLARRGQDWDLLRKPWIG
jgi:UDP-N-acetylmuramyl pentapeptide synthase